MSYSAVQQRWDNFLIKIKSRFEEIVQQTETGLPGLIDYHTFDVVPFLNAWGGINTQLQDLIRKIEDTWSDQVEEAFEEADATNKQTDAERIKGENLEKHLEEQLKKFETRLHANVARQMQERAKEVLSRQFLCTQCKAPLEVKENFYRSYYQTCDYCKTVNTFEPGTIARYVEHFALHALGEEAALEEYFAYLTISENYRKQREDRPKSISKEMLVDTYKKYIDKYLKKRIEIIPDYQERYEKDFEAKVEHVSKWLH